MKQKYKKLVKMTTPFHCKYSFCLNGGFDLECAQYKSGIMDNTSVIIISPL